MPAIRIKLKAPAPQLTKYSLAVSIKDILLKEETNFRQKSSILVISDNHGNFDEFYKQLHQHGIVDRKYHWKFGNRQLLILGSSFNNEHYRQAEFFWLIYALEEKARKNGGIIHYLLPYEYPHNNIPWITQQPNYARSGSASFSKYVALYNGNRELSRWLKTKSCSKKVGDVLFISAIIDTSTIHSSIESSTNPVFSPIHLKKLLDTFRADRIVTVNKADQEGIQFHFKGELLTVNTSANTEILSIKRRRYYTISPDRKIKKIATFSAVRHEKKGNSAFTSLH